MIVIGGHVGPTDLSSNYWCNSTYRPFKILDTATYAWKDRLTYHGYAYSIPYFIYEVIGGKYARKTKSLGSIGMANGHSSTGGATMTSPSTGWPTPALQAIFNPNDVSTIPSVTSLISSSTTSTAPSPTSHSPTTSPHFATPLRIIVGSVIGPLLLVFIVLLSGYLYWKRWRHNNSTPHQSWEKPELAAHSRTLPELSDGTPRSELSAVPIPKPELHGDSRFLELLAPSERKQELAGDPPVVYEVPG